MIIGKVYQPRGEKKSSEDGCQEQDAVDSKDSLPKPRKRPTRAYRAKTSDATALIDALAFSGNHTAVPRPYPQKVDLSYQNPRPGSRRATSPPIDLSSELSLRSLLARYIKFVHPCLDISPLHDHSQEPRQHISKGEDEIHALEHNLDEEALAFLRANGYEVADLVSWCWILTAPSSLSAARRLAMLSEPSISKSVSAGRPVPTFVFLFLLRREYIDAHALKLLIMHMKQRLQLCKSSLRIMDTPSQLDIAIKSDAWSLRLWRQPQPGLAYPIMSEPTLMVSYVRLIRHARSALPAALPSIAILFTQTMHGQSNRNGLSEMELDETTGARLTFLYNKALHLLAMPSPKHPFSSIPHHQRSQFILLRRMNDFSPALVINREGYRAIVQVQLAHRKTLRERDWAGLKASSWPPWKEDKLGLDVEKGTEYGTSRASESLIRMKEAGYGMEAWECTANIYAGWDTDHSPTVQTRTIFPTASSKAKRPSTDTGIEPGVDKDALTWQARIRATRTLNEAWACFLAWQRKALPASPGVYYAMLEKLVFDRKRQNLCEEPGATENTSDNMSQVLPGDGKEVWPEPVSPQEVTYVSTAPPDIDAFFRSMIARGIKPSGRFLAFLIRHAESLRTAVEYIEASALPAETIRFLVDARGDKIPEMQDIIAQMPDYLFTAYIRLLSRHRNLKDGLSTFEKSKDSLSQATSIHGLFDRDRLAYAFQLVSARESPYLPPWYCILFALAHSKSIVVASPELDENAQAILSWKLTRKVLGRMKAINLSVDFQGFQIVCVGLEKAILASKRYLYKVALGIKKNKRSADLIPEAQDVQSKGPHIVKATFTELTNSPVLIEEPDPPPQSPHNPWQTLLEAPGPSQLHAFIRVLGLCQDYDGLLGIILWMVRFAPELEAVADGAANGALLTRRCMIATRVFLERSWLSKRYAGEAGEHEPELEHERVPHETIQKVAEAIESVEAWGGWPTDQEVEAYCEKGQLR